MTIPFKYLTSIIQYLVDIYDLNHWSNYRLPDLNNFDKIHSYWALLSFTQFSYLLQFDLNVKNNKSS